MSRQPTPEKPLCLSADIVDIPGEGWKASLAIHPWGGGDGIPIWEKIGMRTCQNAETAMEAAYQKFQKAARS